MAQSLTGQQLKDKRVSLGVSRSKLAAAVGVAPLTIQRWEKKESDHIPTRILQKVLDFFKKVEGVHIDVRAAPKVYEARLGAKIPTLIAIDEENERIAWMRETLGMIESAAESTRIRIAQAENRVQMLEEEVKKIDSQS